MIPLSNPITIATSTQVFTGISYVSIDNPQERTVNVRINGVRNQLPVWTGTAYDMAGDYTQEELDNAVLSIINSNPTGVLTDLFLRRRR